MTVFIPNCLLDVLRGTTTDAYGDPADADVAVAHGVPAALVETSRTDYEPGSATPRTVRRTRCRFHPGADIRDGDRLRDPVRGVVYRVEGVTGQAGAVGLADVVCALVRVT